MKLTLHQADVIKNIIRMQNGEAEVIIRVYCPFCCRKYALLLIGSSGRYECPKCCKQGKLTDLIVYFEDLFQLENRETIKAMTERSAVNVNRKGGRR